MKTTISIITILFFTSCATMRTVMRPVNDQLEPLGKWELYDNAKMKKNCGTLYQVGRMRIRDKAL